MNVTVIGTGYVGLIAGLGFADWGHDIICLDTDQKKIDSLNAGVCPIYEPGAEDMLRRNQRANRISFTTDTQKAVEFGEIIFIAVGTPEDVEGNANLDYVFQCAKKIGQYMNSRKIIVDKSTVPIGTSREVTRIVKEELDKRGEDIAYVVASNPEFLREGKAIGDFTNPDRIVIGVEDKYAEEKLKKLYYVFNRAQKPIIITSPETAEMIKYASNAFLATKITFINEIANLCDKVGADVNEVAKAMGTDGRISSKFLHSGPGYGGSCFPKDTKALAATGRAYDSPMTIVETVIQANERQKKIAAEKVLTNVPEGSTIGILGLAFKPETDDVREAPAVSVIRELMESKKYNLKVYDPEAMDNAHKLLGNYDNIVWCNSSKEAIKEADAMVVMTEWTEFRSLDYEQIKEFMSGNLIFDFRHIFSREELENLGFTYYGMGF